jgi:hypothetical protein
VIFHSVLQGYRDALCSRIIADLHPNASVQVLRHRQKSSFKSLLPGPVSSLPGNFRRPATPGPVQPENPGVTGDPTQWPTDTMIDEYTWRIDFELPGATMIILLNSY